MSGILVTFLGLLEPVAGAAFAFFFAHERFVSLVYLAGVLILGSLVLQVLASRTDAPTKQGTWRPLPFFRDTVPFHGQDARKHLCRSSIPQGRCTRQLLELLWSMSEGVDVSTLHRVTGLPSGSVYRLLGVLQKRGFVVAYRDSRAIQHYVLHPAWQVSKHLSATFSS
ncbi:hypothetical protein ccbrp13_60100 [Ktedonobacteria bacterium brp13]|nr:hypothetical protein ccbrp13_60100 [Ktedonobacteria bacterium brp13]